MLGCLLGLVVLACPQPAYAYTFRWVDTTSPFTGRVCPIDEIGDYFDYQTNMRRYGLTERIILCVKETVLFATNTLLLPAVSTYMAGTINICITLAILLWGILMVTGKTSAPVRDVFLLGMKAGGVLMFTANFNGWFPLMLDVMESMLNIVTSYVTYSASLNCPNVTSVDNMVVWERVDCAMQTLLGGIFPITIGGGLSGQKTLFLGITGFLVASLYSGTVGVIIAAFGFWIVINFLWTLARALYVFICAYIAFAFMVLISPLFIPMILFRVTKAYFEKWLKLTMGFILQPIFLFAYLAMLLAAFDVVVYTGPRSLYRAITGVHYGQSVMLPDGTLEPFTLGRALFVSGSYKDGSRGAVGFETDYNALNRRLAGHGIGTLDTGVIGDIGEETTNPAQWGNIFGYLGNTVFKVDALTTVVDWQQLALWSNPGCTDPPATCATNYIINLILSFFMAAVTAFIFYILLDKLPFVGSGLTGEPLSTATLGTGRLSPGEQTVNKIKGKLAARFMGGGG
jgi:hypothetical protein